MDQLNGSEGVAGTSENSVGKAEYYIQQLNVNNAKKIALCLVLGFICYHGLIHLRYGEFDGLAFSKICDSISMRHF